MQSYSNTLLFWKCMTLLGNFCFTFIEVSSASEMAFNYMYIHTLISHSLLAVPQNYIISLLCGKNFSYTKNPLHLNKFSHMFILNNLFQHNDHCMHWRPRREQMNAACTLFLCYCLSSKLLKCTLGEPHSQFSIRQSFWNCWCFVLCLFHLISQHFSYIYLARDSLFIRLEPSIWTSKQLLTL